MADTEGKRVAARNTGRISSRPGLETSERHDSLLLDTENYNFFLRSLGDDGEPSERSRATAGRYCQGRREGVRYRFAG
jgi:hypothetical protein